MNVPQNAAFLQEFIWGRYGIDLETRGFGNVTARRAALVGAEPR